LFQILRSILILRTPEEEEEERKQKELEVSLRVMPGTRKGPEAGRTLGKHEG
jgi:hypothetical protein